MPQITMRVSEDVYNALQSAANAANLTLTDYLVSKAIPNYLGDQLTMDKVLKKLSSKRANEVFSIKDLFTKEEWNNFTPGSRISTGRLFFQAYEKGQFHLKNKVEFLGKNSANLAQYKKLTEDED